MHPYAVSQTSLQIPVHCYRSLSVFFRSGGRSLFSFWVQERVAQAATKEGHNEETLKVEAGRQKKNKDLRKVEKQPVHCFKVANEERAKQ